MLLNIFFAVLLHAFARKTGGISIGHNLGMEGNGGTASVGAVTASLSVRSSVGLSCVCRLSESEKKRHDQNPVWPPHFSIPCILITAVRFKFIN